MTDNTDTQYKLYAYVCECGRVERVYAVGPEMDISYSNTARSILDSRPNKCRYAVVERDGGVAVLDTYKLLVDTSVTTGFDYGHPVYVPPEAFTQYTSLEQALMATVLTYTNN